jgi:hypothetical protein
VQVRASRPGPRGGDGVGQIKRKGREGEIRRLGEIWILRSEETTSGPHRIAVARRPYDHVAWAPGLQKQRRAVPTRGLHAAREPFGGARFAYYQDGSSSWT